MTFRVSSRSSSADFAGAADREEEDPEEWLMRRHDDDDHVDVREEEKAAAEPNRATRMAIFMMSGGVSKRSSRFADGGERR